MKKGGITFSPVSLSEPLNLTRKKLKTIRRLTRGTPAERRAGAQPECEVVGHNPSPIVELIIDPVEPFRIATRYHIDEKGKVFLIEQTEVVDGDYDWTPLGGWEEIPKENGGGNDYKWRASQGD
jgi:hypothetical protein